MSTVATLLTRTREDYLQDPDGNEWSDARLTRHVNDAHRWLVDELHHVRGSRWGVELETFSIAADTETYDLSNLTGVGSTREFVAIHRLYHIPPNGLPVAIEPLEDGDEDRSRLGSLVTVTAYQSPRYFTRSSGGSDTLHVLPKASGSRDFRILWRYTPAELTSGQSLETRAAWDDLVAAVAAQRARMGETEVDDQLNAWIERRLEQVKAQAMRQDAAAVGRIIRDEDEFFGSFGGA